MKKLLISGESQYDANLRIKLVPFITSRLAPFLGFTLITILLARINYPELGTFSYLTAMFSVPVVLLSMPLAMIGNLSVDSGKGENQGGKVFANGLPLAILLTLLGYIIAVFMKNHLLISKNNDMDLAAGIYTFCVPALIINTYLFYFIESCISNTVMARVKIITTTISASATTFLAFFVDRLMTWHVFTVFLLIEVILLVLYSVVLLARNEKSGYSYSRKGINKASALLLQLGVPVALGLASQKLVYFLVTQRLAEESISLVSDLSVIMGVISIVSLPFGAFTQIHSLFVSANKCAYQKIYFRTGASFSLKLIALIIIVSSPFYPLILRMYGANMALYSGNYFLSLSGLFATSSLMMFCMGHLRALKDTLIPQSIAVICLLLGFIPVIWLMAFNGGTIYKIIYIQSAFTFLIALVLTIRVVILERNIKALEMAS